MFGFFASFLSNQMANLVCDLTDSQSTSHQLLSSVLACYAVCTRLVFAVVAR